MLPEVSIVITCYNYASFLQDAITSALNQTFQDIEIIVINDGSQDNTDEVIQPYLKNKRIRYFSQPNQGQAVAKNNGIRYSTGKFIAFLDADDKWEKDKLEKQLPLFRNTNVGVVFSLVKYMDYTGAVFFPKIERGKYLQPRRGNVAKWLLFDNFIPFSSSIIRKECFYTRGTFDEKISMGIDWDLWLRFSLAFNFDYVEEPLLVYRVGHPNQMSKNANKRRECADKIFDNFVQSNKAVLPNNWIRKAKSYTFFNIGYSSLNNELKKARWFFIQSLFLDPFNIYSLKGFIKSYLIKTQ